MITELIQDYKVLCMHVTELINKSGYKVDFVRDKLKMSKPGFYAKRKKGNFAPEELMEIMKIIRADEVEDEMFADVVAKHLNDPVLSAKETRKLILG